MRNSLPVAVVLGSSIIAAALFFGLRTPAPPVPASPIVASPPDAAVKSERALPAKPQSATYEQSLAAATAAVASARVQWRAGCWDAAHKAGRYVAVLGFGRDGKLVASGITEDREQSDPAVAQCLRQKVTSISIPPLQDAAVFEIPFALP